MQKLTFCFFIIFLQGARYEYRSGGARYYTNSADFESRKFWNFDSSRLAKSALSS